ncbi:unnamed protein product [Lampetra fluviatilis]
MLQQQQQRGPRRYWEVGCCRCSDSCRHLKSFQLLASFTGGAPGYIYATGYKDGYWSVFCARAPAPGEHLSWLTASLSLLQIFADVYAVGCSSNECWACDALYRLWRKPNIDCANTTWGPKGFFGIKERTLSIGNQFDQEGRLISRVRPTGSAQEFDQRVGSTHLQFDRAGRLRSELRPTGQLDSSTRLGLSRVQPALGARLKRLPISSAGGQDPLDSSTRPAWVNLCRVGGLCCS